MGSAHAQAWWTRARQQAQGSALVVVAVGSSGGTGRAGLGGNESQSSETDRLRARVTRSR